MLSPAPIVIDALRGQAQLGQYRLPVAEAGPAGELRVGGPDGPVLRPLTFAERSRAVNRAAANAQPVDALCAALLRAATVRPGSAPQLPQEILALALAGASEDAPPFVEALLMLARATGWTLQQLEAAEAAQVDRLALHLQTPTTEPGWNRLRLAHPGNDELLSLRSDLAERLLRRATISRAENGEAAEVLPRADPPSGSPQFRLPATSVDPGAGPVQRATPAVLPAAPARAGDASANAAPGRAAPRFRYTLAQAAGKALAGEPLIAAAAAGNGPHSGAAIAGWPAAGAAVPDVSGGQLPGPSFGAPVTPRQPADTALDEFPRHVDLFERLTARSPGLAERPADPTAAPPWAEVVDVGDAVGEWAAHLARLLDDEIDLRGLER